MKTIQQIENQYIVPKNGEYGDTNNNDTTLSDYGFLTMIPPVQVEKIL